MIKSNASLVSAINVFFVVPWNVVCDYEVCVDFLGFVNYFMDYVFGDFGKAGISDQYGLSLFISLKSPLYRSHNLS